jgi:hypothetical protein
MKRKYKTIKRFLCLTLFLSILLWSCNNEKEEVLKIATINISPVAEENARVGKDLTTFDYRNMIIEQLSIDDEEILKNITWQARQAPETTEIIFEVVLKGKAKEKKEELVLFFETFLEKKLPEYSKQLPAMDDVETMANYYISLVEKGNIDTLWPKMSPNFKKFASKDDFNRILQQRKQQFTPSGNRHIDNRRLATELPGGLTGEFYTVTFVYDNQKQEEVTLEKIEGRYKLLGYHFVVKP